MRLDGEVTADGRLWRVTVGLRESEVRELRDSLNALLEPQGDPLWHIHVSSDDYQTELTLVREVIPGE